MTLLGIALLGAILLGVALLGVVLLGVALLGVALLGVASLGLVSGAEVLDWGMASRLGRLLGTACVTGTGDTDLGSASELVTSALAPSSASDKEAAAASLAAVGL